jgi:3-hydroxy-9,10-secoandrosta-1,3,5(10)-triene-9,17-dione monooxygenase reductase component
VLRESGVFAVTFLAEEQERLSRTFAGQVRPFEQVEVHRASTGAPILSEGLAYLDCTLVAEHDVGDHVIILGHVVDLGVMRDEARPLTFFRSDHHALAGRS